LAQSRPGVVQAGRPGRRRVTISTGRNVATAPRHTIPWMLDGMPSRNGITRTRSQRAARKAPASAASSSSGPGTSPVPIPVARRKGRSAPSSRSRRHTPVSAANGPR
jgi:hypothetical protein